MGSLIGSNGRPLGAPAPVARPGEVGVELGLAKGPDGPALSVIFTMPNGAAEQRMIPMTCDVARQLGMTLISVAAIFDMEREAAQKDG